MKYGLGFVIWELVRLEFRIGGLGFQDLHRQYTTVPKQRGRCRQRRGQRPPHRGQQGSAGPILGSTAQDSHP